MQNTTKKRKGNNKEISLSRDKENLPPPEILGKELDECYEELSRDMSWSEIVTMNTRNSGYKDFTVDMFKTYLKHFSRNFKRGRGKESTKGCEITLC